MRDLQAALLLDPTDVQVRHDIGLLLSVLERHRAARNVRNSIEARQGAKWTQFLLPLLRDKNRSWRACAALAQGYLAESQYADALYAAELALVRITVFRSVSPCCDCVDAFWIELVIRF